MKEDDWSLTSIEKALESGKLSIDTVVYIFKYKSVIEFASLNTECKKMKKLSYLVNDEKL